jgi:serine/threonine protein phosphatase PrpC
MLTDLKYPSKNIYAHSLEELNKNNENTNPVYVCLNIMVMQNNKVYSANVGGCRLFFIQRTKYKNYSEAKFITAYHTKENIIEMYRVKREQSGEQNNNKLATIAHEI